MNGAESLVRSLVAGGIDTCFTNPGTSEMHMVAALERTPEIRCLLTLFEGVATGAADGYARMTGKPACTLLHLGPGLANGVANLHNARRAQMPIVNVIGDHATFHLQHDAPLTSDIEGIAKPVSGWVRTSRNAGDVGRDAIDAIVAARTAPGQIATHIVAADAAWSDGGVVSCVAEFCEGGDACRRDDRTSGGVVAWRRAHGDFAGAGCVVRSGPGCGGKNCCGDRREIAGRLIRLRGSSAERGARLLSGFLTFLSKRRSC